VWRVCTILETKMSKALELILAGEIVVWSLEDKAPYAACNHTDLSGKGEVGKVTRDIRDTTTTCKNG
jgi:hypothetical protein